MWYLRNYYILLGRDENKYLDIISSYFIAIRPILEAFNIQLQTKISFDLLVSFNNIDFLCRREIFEIMQSNAMCSWTSTTISLLASL